MALNNKLLLRKVDDEAAERISRGRLVARKNSSKLFSDWK